MDNNLQIQVIPESLSLEWQPLQVQLHAMARAVLKAMQKPCGDKNPDNAADAGA